MAAGPAGLGVRPHAARSAGCNAVPVPVAFATDAWKLLAETRSDVGACWVRWTAERERNRYEERSTAWLHCCTPNPLVDLTGGAIGLGLCRYNFDVTLHRCRKENGVGGRVLHSPGAGPVAAAMRRHSGSAAPCTQKLLDICALIGQKQGKKLFSGLFPLHLSTSQCNTRGTCASICELSTTFPSLQLIMRMLLGATCVRNHSWRGPRCVRVLRYPCPLYRIVHLCVFDVFDVFRVALSQYFCSIWLLICHAV